MVLLMPKQEFKPPFAYRFHWSILVVAAGAARSILVMQQISGRRYGRCKESILPKDVVMLPIVLMVFLVLAIEGLLPIEYGKRLREERRNQLLESAAQRP